MENKREEEERQLSSILWYEISQISQSESVMIFSLGGGDSYVAKGSWASYQGLGVQLPLRNEGDRPRTCQLILKSNKCLPKPKGFFFVQLL